MIDKRALTELTKHYDEAANKHPPFADPTEVAHKIQDRLSKVVSAIGSTHDKDCNAEIGRRLTQCAVIALRGVVNLAYPVAPPRHPLTPSPLPPDPPADATADEMEISDSCTP